MTEIGSHLVMDIVVLVESGHLGGVAPTPGEGSGGTAHAAGAAPWHSDHRRIEGASSLKDRIRSVLLGLGVDDVGVASVDEYRSPASLRVESLFPGARSLIVMAFRELAVCESPSPQLAMNVL